jgi:hypothetical protein
MSLDGNIATSPLARNQAKRRAAADLPLGRPPFQRLVKRDVRIPCTINQGVQPSERPPEVVRCPVLRDLAAKKVQTPNCGSIKALPALTDWEGSSSARVAVYGQTMAPVAWATDHSRLLQTDRYADKAVVRCGTTFLRAYT